MDGEEKRLKFYEENDNINIDGNMVIDDSAGDISDDGSSSYTGEHIMGTVRE